MVSNDTATFIKCTSKLLGKQKTGAFTPLPQLSAEPTLQMQGDNPKSCSKGGLSYREAEVNITIIYVG